VNKKIAIWVISLPLLAMIGSAFLLTAIFGPSDNGLSCTRNGAESACEIRQTRFFGLIGNSSFSIPESRIRGAKSVCSSGKIGGHSSPSCSVYLTLEDGEQYPVLSYSLISQADSAAAKLNLYLRDGSARSIEINEDVRTPVLMFGIAPVALVMLLFACLRSWRFRRPPLAVQGQA
jgi:hypothetical protein